MAMATSESQKRAFKKYAKTEKGKEALRRGAEKYQSTEEGQQKLIDAQKRFEESEKRKAYRREWDRKNRARLRQKKRDAEKSEQ